MEASTIGRDRWSCSMPVACFGVELSTFKQITSQHIDFLFQGLTNPIRQPPHRIVVFATAHSRGMTITMGQSVARRARVVGGVVAQRLSTSVGHLSKLGCIANSVCRLKTCSWKVLQHRRIVVRRRRLSPVGAAAILNLPSPCTHAAFGLRLCRLKRWPFTESCRPSREMRVESRPGIRSKQSSRTQSSRRRPARTGRKICFTWRMQVFPLLHASSVIFKSASISVTAWRRRDPSSRVTLGRRRSMRSAIIRRDEQ